MNKEILPPHTLVLLRYSFTVILGMKHSCAVVDKS